MLKKKKTVYELGGFREYWILDIKQKVVLIHQLKGDLYQVTSHKQATIFPQDFPDITVNLD